MTATIPLFPLNAVLYPGGPLPLRIFETRYLDMVSLCLKQEAGFGVCLIEQGSETGPARTY
ncbi:MAG: LON peptidase substrate-binding domain-containing protein, partial [Gammaproteobacteria bacterium]